MNFQPATPISPAFLSSDDLDNHEIEWENLPKQAQRVLKRYNYTHIFHLAASTPSELIRMEGLGRVSFSAIEKYMKRKGYDFVERNNIPPVLKRARLEVRDFIKQIEEEKQMRDAYAKGVCICASCYKQMHVWDDWIREVQVNDTKNGRPMFSLQYCKNCYFKLPVSSDYTALKHKV